MVTGRNIFVSFHVLIILAAGMVCSVFLCPEQTEVKMLFGLYHRLYHSFNLPLFFQFAAVAVLYFFSNACPQRTTLINMRNEGFKLLLDAAIVFFLLGINLPVIKSVKLGFFSSETSLIQIILQLFDSAEYLLFFIMLVFTFILPIVKLAVLILNLYSDVKLGYIISLLSKWGMADMLIIGIVVAVSKSGSQMFILQTSQGLPFFALSVLLSSVIVYLRR